MILVDTSVWVDHFRHQSHALSALLDEGRVACHPFVIGEVALGALKNRTEILASLAELPAAPAADHGEVLSMIERRALAGTGIGWVDAHLIASTLVAHGRLWTVDRRLGEAARTLGISWEP
jgi:predicted nucleic acid-binding protein